MTFYFLLVKENSVATQQKQYILSNILVCILFLPPLYNCLWVLACSIIPLQGFLSCAFCFQLFTPIFIKSSLTSSSHLNLGLSFGLVACGFHYLYVYTALIRQESNVCRWSSIYFPWVRNYYRSSREICTNVTKRIVPVVATVSASGLFGRNYVGSQLN